MKLLESWSDFLSVVLSVPTKPFIVLSAAKILWNTISKSYHSSVINVRNDKEHFTKWIKENRKIVEIEILEQ